MPQPSQGNTIQKGRGTSWVRVQVDIWTPTGAPLLTTSPTWTDYYHEYLFVATSF